MNRRDFTTLALAPLASAAGGPLTAEAILARIESGLGGTLPPNSPDGLKAGSASTLVRGIATTAMATLDVLKKAAAANTNLVLTYEPTFYGRAENASPADAVVKAKREFIEKNGLVVYRLRDRWQASKGDEMIAALAGALGWSKGNSGIYEIRAATGADTVAAIRRKLDLSGGLRAVGDRKATIRRVLLHPGSMTPAVMWKRYSEVDMVIAGEVREWENTLYAADMFTAGEKRVLVTIGRVVSEDPGMRACAQWLKTVVPEVPAKWIGADDPYWRPA